MMPKNPSPAPTTLHPLLSQSATKPLRLIKPRYNRRVKNVTPKLSTLAQRIAPESVAGTDADSPSDQLSDNAWAVHNRAVEKARAGEAVIFLSIGQEDNETTPANIVAQAVNSLNTGDHHYSDVEGSPELREAIAAYHKRLTKQSVTEEQCTVYCGAQNGLFAVAQAVLEPGCDVVLSEPYYTTYPACFTASGATARLLAAITPNTRAVVLNTPNNPMGECYSAQALARIVNTCKERGVWLILDLVYAELVDPSALHLPHHLPGADDVIISVGSVSKSHRMTGWRAGWVVAPQRVATTLANLSMCMHYGLTPFVMKAAAYALNHDQETPVIIRQALAERRKILHQHLKGKPGVDLIDSGQGMFVLLNVSHTGYSAKRYAMELLERTGVAVLPCDGFGPTGANLVRISLAVDSLDLISACNAIAAFSVSLEE